MKGNRVQPKVWKEKLTDDLHVLVAFDGRLPHPRERTDPLSKLSQTLGEHYRRLAAKDLI